MRSGMPEQAVIAFPLPLATPGAAAEMSFAPVVGIHAVKGPPADQRPSLSDPTYPDGRAA